MDIANANNRTKGAITNAQALLSIDLEELDSQQKSNIYQTINIPHISHKSNFFRPLLANLPYIIRDVNPDKAEPVCQSAG